MVREIRTCRIEVSHQYPASWSLSVNGSGSRCSPPLDEHVDRPGPEPVTDHLQRGAGITGGEPVGQRGEPDPGPLGLPLNQLMSLAVAVWGVLAWRALAQSVTLTPDTLVIRNVLATEQAPLADVTEVSFRRGRLTVTSAHGAAASQRFTVSAVNLGPSRWSGLRSTADAIAEAITDATGLPPLPPRKEIISRNWAWIMLLAAALCFGLGVYSGPLQSGNTGLPFALRETGVVLYVSGAGMLSLAFRITRDHRRERTRQAADDEKN
jgi:hypothetical protein